MSAPAQTPLQTSLDGSDVDLLRLSHNKLVALLDTFDDRVMGLPGCATATVTSQAKTTNTVTFSIDGRLFSKAATDNFWTLTGATFAAGLSNKWLLLVDAAGAASVLIGTPATTLAAVVLPTPPASKSVFGVLSVANATNPFIPGTTLLGAAGVTATFIDGLDPLYTTQATSAIAAALILSHK